MLKFNANSFKFKDLVVSVFPRKKIDAVGYCLERSPTVDTCGQLSPLVLPVDLTRYIRVLDQIDIFKVKAAELDSVAINAGKALVGAKLAAMCTSEMPTCDANPNISPFARTEVLEAGDLIEARIQLESALKTINYLEESIEKHSRESIKDVKKHLDDAMS